METLQKGYEQLYSNILDNIEEMDKFWEIQTTRPESWRDRNSEQTNYS